MTDDLHLRRKWTLRAHGRQVVFVKKPVESTEHVLMKALLWALYLPEYPDLIVEIRIGDRYKPDVVALDAEGESLFWGEAGEVSTERIRSLALRYRRMHVAGATERLGRKAPFGPISFPDDAVERFIDDGGVIQVRHEDLTWLRM